MNLREQKQAEFGPNQSMLHYSQKIVLLRITKQPESYMVTNAKNYIDTWGT